MSCIDAQLPVSELRTPATVGSLGKAGARNLYERFTLRAFVRVLMYDCAWPVIQFKIFFKMV